MGVEEICDGILRRNPECYIMRSHMFNGTKAYDAMQIL